MGNAGASHGCQHSRPANPRHGALVIEFAPRPYALLRVVGPYRVSRLVGQVRIILLATDRLLFQIDNRPTKPLYDFVDRRRARRACGLGTIRGDDLDCAIFYMDMRTYGKDFERYYNRAREDQGVRFIRSRIHTIEEDPNTHDLFLQYVDELGNKQNEN